MLIIVFSVSMCFAENREVVLVKSPVIVEEDPIEWRMPSKPIHGTISEEGIFIQGVDTDEIQSYEVYDLDGSCLLVTNDLQEFVSFILDNNDIIEVRFLLSSFLLKGFISIVR